MTTAPVEHAPVDELDYDVDQVIRVVVRMLMARDGVNVEELAGRSGVSRDVLFRRLRLRGGTSWKANEVARLARYFRVPVAEFYAPSGPLGEGFRKGRFLTLPAELAA